MIIIYCFKDYYKYFEDYVNSLLAHIPKKKKILLHEHGGDQHYARHRGKLVAGRAFFSDF